MKIVQDAFLRRTEELDRRLGVGRSFDMVGRSLTIGGRRARLWVVNGYADDAVLERAVAGWLAIRDLAGVNTAEAFAARYVTVSDAAAEQDMAKAVTAVLAGKTLLVIDGLPGGVLMDAKQFPLRGIEEPDTSKVMDFLMGENRFASLKNNFPDKADALYAKEVEDVKARYAKYKKLAEG